MNIMKIRNIFRILSAGVVLSCLASCHNREQIFPDYEGGVTAYFAYQYPVRTIVFGESETFDTSLDNQGKCIIYGTMGGAYQGKDIVLDIEVDNTLADNLYFDAEATMPVKAMPSEYYKLSGSQLKYEGNHMGGVEVQLTDAFFADPDALKNTYVIPVVMTKIVKGADQINDGEPLIEGETPVRTDPTYWNKTPKDYTLYCIKYINQWDGSWLRRGKDVITGQDAGENVRHAQYVENDEVVYLTSKSLQSVEIPISTNVTRSYTEYADGGNGIVMGQEEAQANTWNAQVWYNLSAPLKSDVEYVMTFKGKATSAYTAGVWYQDSTNGEGQEYGPTCEFGTQWEDKTLTLKVTGAAKNKIVFNFGDFAGSLMLDDVTLVEKGTEENLIVNGDFEDAETGVSNWQSWGKYEALGTGCVSEVKTAVEGKTCNVVLTFDESGNCTVSSATEGISASGSGKYVKDGEKMAWGEKDRDGIYLDYTVDFGEKKFAVRDTLVSRSREVSLETYSPTYKK